jgi:hypothetical protein
MQGGSYWTGAQRREARSILAFFSAGAILPLNWPENADAKPPYPFFRAFLAFPRAFAGPDLAHSGCSKGARARCASLISHVPPAFSSRGGGREHGLIRAWSEGMRSPLRRSAAAQGTHSLGGSGSYSRAAGGKRYPGNQRKLGESAPGWHNTATPIQAGASLGKLLLHLILFSSLAYDQPRPERSWTLSGHVGGTSPRPAERDITITWGNTHLQGRWVGRDILVIAAWHPGFCTPGWHWALQSLQPGL